MLPFSAGGAAGRDYLDDFNEFAPFGFLCDGERPPEASSSREPVQCNCTNVVTTILKCERSLSVSGFSGANIRKQEYRIGCISALLTSYFFHTLRSSINRGASGCY